MSFIDERVQPTGLTFDDVLLVPAYSEVLPREVNVTSRFSRNIKLNIPIVSAAMDTVTEAPLAIALAREGGIGVIHKNMSIAEQAAHVRRVKRAENGMIYDPITISKEHTVGDALALMQENKIGGIPVIDAERRLIGIVTNRDLRFQRDMHRLISEVMTSENLITTHSSELAHAADVLLNNKIEKLPVVDNEGKLVGLITYKDITKVQDHPNACKDSKGRLRVAAGVGVTGDSMERVDALVGEDVDAIVLDSAHGHSANIVALLRRIKAKYPELDVVVGNIATAEAAKFLIDAGADGIKVGIGPGSICTTRIIAGVGVPQLSAIYSAASAAHRRRWPALFGRHRQGAGRRRRLRDDRLDVRRHGGVARRHDHLQRPQVQELSRHGFDRRHEGGFGRPLFPERRGQHQQTRSRRDRGARAVQGFAQRNGLPARRRHPRRHGILRRGGHRDAQTGTVHPHYRQRRDRKPPARRDDHQRGAQLQQRTLIAPSIRNLRYSDAMQEKILIIDFGSQYTQLIARRVRELSVYCEIHPFNHLPAIDASVRGVILSGSPFSVRDAEAPRIDLSAIKGRRCWASATARNTSPSTSAAR